MKHHYTLICYKPSSDDYCKGHIMARYRSDHVIIDSEDQKFIAEQWAVYEEAEMAEREKGFEITLLVDGRDRPFYSGETEEDVAGEELRYKCWDEVFQLKESRIEASRKYRQEERQRKEAVAKAEKERKEAEAKTLELEKAKAEYERLKKIFENTPAEEPKKPMWRSESAHPDDPYVESGPLDNKGRTTCPDCHRHYCQATFGRGYRINCYGGAEAEGM